MKRILPLFTMLVFASSLAFGQLAPNSIAPNFTTTDINGNTITLYDLLDEGKTVILDVFAVWCGPCWSYHQNHILEDAFNQFGPNGTDELYIIAVEADGSTNESCITSATNCNGFSYGDWTEGISYPIVDDASIGNAYQIIYFPTIYMIYPNRLVSEMGQVNAETLEEWKNRAPQLKPGVNAEVINYNGIDGSVCSANWVSAPTYTISNMGEEVITSADISIYTNGEELLTQNWTGGAAPYSIMAQIQATPQLLSENTEYELRITNINGDPSTSISYESGISFQLENSVGVSVQGDENMSTDGNYYSITDQNGQIVVFQDLESNNELFETIHHLPAEGCYTFSINDNAGNGINGAVKVTDIAGNIIFRSDYFGASAGSDFYVSAVTSTDDMNSSVSFDISPNPVTDKLTVDIDAVSMSALEMQICSITGRVIEQSTLNVVAGKNTLQLDLNGYANGLYFLVLRNENGTTTKKFIKE